MSAPVSPGGGIVLDASAAVKLVLPEEHSDRAAALVADTIRAHRLTRTYDALYVVLAQLLGLELWTDDRALINTLAGAAPWVRWIGVYPTAADASHP